MAGPDAVLDAASNLKGIAREDSFLLLDQNAARPLARDQGRARPQAENERAVSVSLAERARGLRRKGNGTPAVETQRRAAPTVKAMTACGIRQREICAVIGVSVPTLEKKFRTEVDTGLAMANSKVAESMFKLATKGHPTHVRYQAAAFWLKCRAGCKEASTVEIIKPISQMTREEIRLALQINDPDQSRLTGSWGARGNGNVVPLQR